MILDVVVRARGGITQVVGEVEGALFVCCWSLLVADIQPPVTHPSGSDPVQSSPDESQIPPPSNSLIDDRIPSYALYEASSCGRSDL